MSKIIEYFKTIATIPHCSGKSDALFAYLISYAKSMGYEVWTDDADNILAHKGSPKLALQAHYDMVCVGRAPEIEIYEESGWLKAQDSTLGADNGIAIAMMMDLMSNGVDMEFLFTSDEEVGLVGAGKIELDISAKYILNLDSEDEAVVTIGCAGGADVIASVSDSVVDGEGKCFEVAVKGLSGGHSGVDIDKDIPSAIKLLGEYLQKYPNIQIATIVAGERRNSIPANAVAIVRSTEVLNGDELVSVRELNEDPKVYAHSQTIIDLLADFKQGVWEMNSELGIPDASANLALVYLDGSGKGELEVSLRAMDNGKLEEMISEVVSYMEMRGLVVSVEDRYPAWKPHKGEFVDQISRIIEDEFGRVEVSAIHAGLECGILSEKFPDKEFASIGPTIKYPHSTRECVDVASVERTYQALLRIIEAFDDTLS